MDHCNILRAHLCNRFSMETKRKSKTFFVENFFHHLVWMLFHMAAIFQELVEKCFLWECRKKRKSTYFHFYESYTNLPRNICFRLQIFVNSMEITNPRGEGPICKIHRSEDLHETKTHEGFVKQTWFQGIRMRFASKHAQRCHLSFSHCMRKRVLHF